MFFDRHGAPRGHDAGFDAVVGNPPYINATELNKTLSEYEKPYWKQRFSSAVGAYDIYILFLEQALRLVCGEGLVGLITPNKYLSAPYGAALRAHLAAEHTMVRLRDLSRARVFEDASVYPVISIVKRGRSTRAYTVTVERAAASHVIVFQHSSRLLALLPDRIWGFLLTDGVELTKHIIGVSETLSKAAQVNASTSTAEADSYTSAIVEEGSLPTGTYWKVVNTGLIDRYTSLWGYAKLTHQHRSFGRPVLPQHAPVVSQNRFQQYSRPKLIFAKMALRVESLPDPHAEYASMNTNFALAQTNGVDVSFLGAICNSRLMQWVYAQYFHALRMSGGYYQFQAPQLRTLPIRRITFLTSHGERAARNEEALTLIHGGDGAALDRFVDDRLAATPEQSDVVHDVLTHLANQMVAVATRRQEAREAFMLDLEGILSAGGARRLGRLWVPPAVAAPEAQKRLGILAVRPLDLRADIGLVSEDQWKWLLEIRLGRVENLSGLVKTYRQHQPAIAALDQQLVSLDSLIDRIVYRLYGLTEAQVETIEQELRASAEHEPALPEASSVEAAA